MQEGPSYRKKGRPIEKCVTGQWGGLLGITTKICAREMVLGLFSYRECGENLGTGGEKK